MLLRPLIVLAGLALIALVAGCAGGDDELAATPVEPPAERRAAPALSVPRLFGEGELSLDDYRGAPVVLNFWASWCGPCREETPELVKFAEQTPQVAVVGVAVNDSPAASRAFAREFGVGYDLGVDRRGTASARFGVTGLPVSVILDDEGRVVSTFFGAIGRDDLDLFVEQLGV